MMHYSFQFDDKCQYLHNLVQSIALFVAPAYDLLNSRIHIEDKDFALEDGLLPRNLAQAKIGLQFAKLAEKAEISEKTFQDIMALMISKSAVVEKMVAASFLNDSTKRNYFQSYKGRLKQLTKV